MNGKVRKRKIKYCLRGQDGVTLVELIVTFAMIGLFMTAAAFMITSSLRLFTRMQATSRAITVSDMILDKVAGEISAAAFPVGQPKQDDYYFWLDPNGEWVVFKNRLDSPIAIFAANRNEDGTAKTDTLGEGELFVRYYKLEGSNVQKQAELDWRYDDRVYMGYRISDLKFSQADAGKDPSVIRIDLTLVHKDTKFEYPTHRYAKVYNMAYTGPYLGSRSEFEPENTGLPVEAKEFEIKKKDPGSGEGEKQENTFRVHHMYGSTLILEEIFTGIPGTVMTIYAKSPSDEGFENYVPKKSSMEITVDELGIVRTYYFEYELKKDVFSHPFVTDGNKIEVEENDKKIYGIWYEIAEKVKEFFNSQWYRIEGSKNKIGYYQTFSYGEKHYVIGGWEDKKGNLKEFEDAVKEHSGKKNCEVMVINSPESHIDVLRELLLFCAEQANAGTDELDFIKTCKMKFEFEDGVNLDEIKLEDKDGNKKKIEIEYED